MKECVDITVDYLFNEDYKRILDGNVLNMVNKPYSIRYVEKMLSHYRNEEDYEKCRCIKDYLDNRTDHMNGWLLE